MYAEVLLFISICIEILHSDQKIANIEVKYKNFFILFFIQLTSLLAVSIHNTH